MKCTLLEEEKKDVQKKKKEKKRKENVFLTILSLKQILGCLKVGIALAKQVFSTCMFKNAIFRLLGCLS